MDLNLAQVFLALWHERSVSRAAVRLALTQPAVSASLRRLRALCGDELFVRTRYGMQPTSRATTMASVLEECVDTLRGALGQRGEFNPAFSSRSFVVGCDGGLDYALGPYLMAKIREVAPNVTLTARAVPADTMNLTLERREIEIRYQKVGADKPEIRRIQPYHLGEVEKGWYLIGRDLDRKALRTFSLSRTTGVKVLATKFQRPADFNAHDHLKHSFGIWKSESEGPLLDVRVELTGYAARLVPERLWHESQEIKELNEKGSRVEIRMKLANLPEITRWVLSWGSQAKVIGPPELVQAVRAEAMAVAAASKK